jgi:putative zinc finger/helix-turn-helix YgiT family protein
VESKTMKKSRRAVGPRNSACIECGTSMKASRGPHRYTITPKWAVTIADAEILRCPKCGALEVVIPKPDALQRTIAAEVIRKPARLAGPEIVFLRRSLGLTGRAMAKTLGVSHEALSRWENDAHPVPPTVDRLLRTTVALQTLEGERFPVETLASIEGEAGPLKLVVTVDPRKGSWKRAA